MTPLWLKPVLQAAQDLMPLLVSLFHAGFALAVTVHALLNKRNVHKAVGWIALAWLAPVAGALL